MATPKSKLSLSEAAFKTTLNNAITNFSSGVVGIQKVTLSALALMKEDDETIGNNRDVKQMEILLNRLDIEKSFKGKQDLINFIYIAMGAYEVPLDAKGKPQVDADGYTIRVVDMDKVCRSLDKKKDRQYHSAVMAAVDKETNLLKFAAVPWGKRSLKYQGVDLEWAQRINWWDMPKPKTVKKEVKKLSNDAKVVKSIFDSLNNPKVKLTDMQRAAFNKAIKAFEEVPVYKTMLDELREEVKEALGK